MIGVSQMGSMSKKETIEFFRGHGFEMSSDRGNKRIIFTVKSWKEIGGELGRGERCTSCTHHIREMF